MSGRWVGWLVGLCCTLGLAADTLAAPGRMYGEAWLSNPAPFVKEPLLYTVRIYSSVDLRTLQIVPPVVTDATLDRLDEPQLSGTVTLDGTRYVTSDIRYILTPLRAGGLQIGPARITLEYGGGPDGTQPGEETFHSQPLKLEVRDAKALEHEWRPLQWLDLQAKLDAAAEPRVGQPLILSVDIRARGSRGDQLPSVATQLAVPGFKVYPERPQVDTRIQQPGHIWGRRVENYTVVPTRDGDLEIPEITIHWWDLNRQREMTGRVPARQLQVLPALATNTTRALQVAAAEASPAAGVGTFLMVVLVAITGGYALFWLLGDAGGGQLRIHRLKARAGVAVAGWLALLGALLVRLRKRLVLIVDGAMPFAVQYWWWRRLARRAEGAPGLRRMLRSFATIRLGLPPRSTLYQLGERLAAGAPDEDGEVIRHLMHQLDDESYGRGELDLDQWKEEWEMVLGGCLSRSRRSAAKPAVDAQTRHRLPALNP